MSVELLKRTPDDPDGWDAPPIDERERVDDRARRRRIRCPKCGYEPTSHDRWSCSCFHRWNTFDTGGRCPACSRQWLDTACPMCGEWSAHVDWYEPDA